MTESEEFVPFDEKAGESAEITPIEEAAAETAVEAVAATDLLLAIHAAVSEGLAKRVAQEGIDAVALAADAFATGGNLVGVGVGSTTPTLGSALEFSAAPPGAPALNVYLVEPMEDWRVREVLATEFGAEATEEVPIQRVVTGEIAAQAHTFRMRPAPGGVSTGHFRVTAGTLGCLARGRDGEREERLLVLSNNHVLADSNAGSFGEAILQPGTADGGVRPQDQIAALERFVPIDFSGQPNLVDCATGWADPDLVRREIVYLRQGQPSFFRLDPNTATCREQMPVAKSGRTTQLTSGVITDCSATIRVRYGARTALFRDQIAVRGLEGDFSRPGDSGSVVFTRDDRRSPVGLLFAGGTARTFANKIDHVLQALDIRLVV